MTQLASNGSTTFAAVNDLAVPMTPDGFALPEAAIFEGIEKGTGELVAVNQDTVPSRGTPRFRPRRTAPPR